MSTDDTSPSEAIADDTPEIAIPGDDGSRAGARTDTNWRRSALLGGGLLLAAVLVTVLVVILNSGRKEPPPSVVNIGGGGDKATRSAPTSEYRREIDAANQEGAARARAQGRAFVPDVVDEEVRSPTGAPDGRRSALAPASDSKNPASGSAPPSIARPPPVTSESPGAVYPVHTTAGQPQYQAVAASSGQQAMSMDAIERLARSWSPGGEPTAVTIESRRAQTAGAAAPTAAGSGSGGPGGQQEAAPPGMAQAAGKAFAAVLDKRVETDIAPRVIATIVHGPFNGAQMRGVAKRTFDNLRIEFNEMLFQGARYKVAALGIDEITSNDLMEGRVDRRIMERYVLPIALGAASTAASLIVQPTGSVVMSGYGVTQINTEPPTSKQITAATVKGGIDAVKDIYTAELPPKTVVLEAGMALGVFFF